jgi:hypothetical protein
MEEKKYIVVTPIKVPGDKKGTSVKIEPGKSITLTEDEAAPLLKCGAIREPDVVAEEDTKKSAAKK